MLVHSAATPSSSLSGQERATTKKNNTPNMLVWEKSRKGTSKMWYYSCEHKQNMKMKAITKYNVWKYIAIHPLSYICCNTKNFKQTLFYKREVYTTILKHKTLHWKETSRVTATMLLLMMMITWQTWQKIFVHTKKQRKRLHFLIIIIVLAKQKRKQWTRKETKCKHP